VNVLLEEIWQGKLTFECDGRFQDFSQLTYLASAPIKKLPGREVKAQQLVSNNFIVNVEDSKYWFQYRYRHNSIAYIFKKDFLSALGMVLLFQYINFKYLTLFNAASFEGLEGYELYS